MLVHNREGTDIHLPTKFPLIESEKMKSGKCHESDYSILRVAYKSGFSYLVLRFPGHSMASFYGPSHAHRKNSAEYIWILNGHHVYKTSAVEIETCGTN